MNIFKHLDYIDALTELVEVKKKINKKFTYGRISEAIQVHRPYLSRVIKKQADLSDDQWFDLLQYLDLDTEENYYLTLIHQFTRSSNRKRKKILLDQIKEIQKNKSNSAKELEAKTKDADSIQDDPALSEYYLEPLLAIVHFYFTIEEVQKNPQLICERFKISEKELSEAIKKLTHLGFIGYDSKTRKYAILVDHIHLKPESILTKYSQNMMRLKSLEQVSQLDRDRCYNFSVTLSTDKESKEELKQEFMNFLKKAEKIVRSSTPKKVFQMNFDLFPWERD